MKIILPNSAGFDRDLGLLGISFEPTIRSSKARIASLIISASDIGVAKLDAVRYSRQSIKAS